MNRSLLVVAGEVSGDLLAGEVIRILRRDAPDIAVWGIGGERLAAAGADLRRHVRDMAVMGLAEVLRRYGFFRRALNDLVAEAERRPPAAALLVDYPGFNLRLAARLHARGIRVIYYVCPQVWAWHRERIPQMARILDRLLVLFPFETAVFAGTGLPVEFVGHPLVDIAAAARAAPETPLPWGGAPRIALLPGSRRQEIERILPPMLGAARRLEAIHPDAGFLIAAASEEARAVIERVRRAAPAGPARLAVVAGAAREVLRQARAAWVASGTATVDAALMDCPCAVVYRTSPLTYALARRLVKVPHIGMVNLIAGREVCPERIQGAARPGPLIEALLPLIAEGPARQQALDGLADVRRALGPGGAAERAAAAVRAALSW